MEEEVDYFEDLAGDELEEIQEKWPEAIGLDRVRRLDVPSQ